mmetsp:Transcript_30571/g.63990  ORF Transcript_30571/g.63990 Transcript_30571/m.63990 type:complete len:301 (+) Transcript_30571:164-1066(+)
MNNNNNNNNDSRRQFLSKAALSIPLLVSLPANAGIDVSGLRVEGGPPSNSVIASQLKGVSSSDSGTAASRLREINQSTTSAAEQRRAAEVTAGQRPVLSREELGNAAVYARVSGASSVQSFGLSKLNSHYNGYVESPSGKLLPIQFDLPTDWLQLDRVNGGIQYVDQRNGNKLYVLKAPLPPGTDLATVPKSFFDEAVFDEKSDLIRFGTVVGAHKTTKSSMTQEDAKAAYLHRRLQLNYETLAGNGVQTIERRGLVDAYEIEGYAYMMLASGNAIKFDKKDSPERGTIDMIVDSFLLGQ